MSAHHTAARNGLAIAVMVVVAARFCFGGWGFCRWKSDAQLEDSRLVLSGKVEKTLLFEPYLVEYFPANTFSGL